MAIMPSSELKVSRSLILAILVGALTALLPVVLATYLSWVTALDKESTRLMLLGQDIIKRTDQIFDGVSTTLRGLDGSPAPPCSAKHIAELRRLTINSLFIDEIGYVENGMLRCTSWGVTAIRVKQGRHDFTTRDGLVVVANLAPVVTDSMPVMALRSGSYNALVNPVRIVNFPIEEQLSIAVYHASGTLIAAHGATSVKLNPPALDSTRQIRRDGDQLIVTVQEGEWITVLSEPGAAALAPFMQQLFLFVPFGMILGGVMGGLIYGLARKRLSPANDLALAIKRREFVVHYQPIIDVQTGDCIGAEALVRRTKQDGSLRGPDTFLPLADEAGLTPAITRLVIENVIADLSHALVANRDLHISINFSATHVQSGDALELLESLLRGTRIDPSQIWLEITERTLMELEPARLAIERARALGYRMLIDDFGTGYSSLRYLSSLPITGVKIDKSFVDAIGKEAATSSVIPAITQMAKTLELMIVAEGVENHEQVEYLVEQGVDYLQGWLYAKALPAQKFMEFLQHGSV